MLGSPIPSSQEIMMQVWQVLERQRKPIWWDGSGKGMQWAMMEHREIPMERR